MRETSRDCKWREVQFCSLCGLYGHLVHSCPKKPQEIVSVPTVQARPKKDRGKVISTAEEGFTQVRRGRRQPMEVLDPARIGNRTCDARIRNEIRNIAVSTSFGSLEENM